MSGKHFLLPIWHALGNAAALIKLSDKQYNKTYFLANKHTIH